MNVFEHFWKRHCKINSGSMQASAYFPQNWLVHQGFATVKHFVSGGVVPIQTPQRLRLCSFLLPFLACQESHCSCRGWPGVPDFAADHPKCGFFFYFCDGLFTVKEAKQATLQLPRSFSTVARFELEPQIRETQSYQTSSSGNMPRRNLHCKYYVLKHITIQALEATQSHNAPSLTMLTLYHCKLQLRPFHFEVW